MLKSIHNSSRTKSNTHHEGVARFRRKIDEAQYHSIGDWILEQFSNSKAGWVNTTFAVPPDWTNTPLHAIWEYNEDIPDFDERHRQSAILYGCVFYTFLFDRPETYLFHRHEGHHPDETTPYGLTYRRE